MHARLMIKLAIFGNVSEVILDFDESELHALSSLRELISPCYVNLHFPSWRPGAHMQGTLCEVVHDC